MQSRGEMRPLICLIALIVCLFSTAAQAQSTAAFPSALPPAEPAATAPTAVNDAPSVSPAPRQVATPEPIPPAAEPRVTPMRLPPVVDRVSIEGTPQEVTNWYGWQTLATDGAALTLAVTVAAVNDRNKATLGFAALAAYLAGGPIVHAAHGNWGRAFGSAGLRVGAPIAGAFLGAVLESCHGGDYCGASGAAVGLVVGTGMAIALDAAVLAREKVIEEPTLLPVVATGKDGTYLGLAGRF